MNKYLKQVFIVSLLVIILVLPYFVFATDSALDKLEQVGTGGTGETGAYQPAGETTIAEIMGAAVSAFLGLLGVIFIALIIYAGYYWMTAEGEEEKVIKAKDTIRQAIIGLVLVIAAYAIWAFIKAKLIGG